MKTILLAAAILIAVPAIGQEVQHAPTAAQCQADRAVWSVQADEWVQAEIAHSDRGTANLSALNKMTVDGIHARAEELGTCNTVDPANQQMYSLAADNYSLIYLSRLTHFMTRHGLFSQFFEEDSQGQR
jgi:hypothetical protein